MYEYKAVVDKVVDGDTAHLTIDLGLDSFIKITVRIAGIDAPEMSTQEGRAAKEFAKTLIPEGSTVVVRTIKDKREKYGRYLANFVLAGGKDFSSEMIKAGHAIARF